MIATLTALRITVWRRTPNAMRPLGIALGALLTLGTLAVAGGAWSAAEPTGALLALVFAAWLVGWVLGPIQTGGSDTLRPEWFAMVPLRSRDLSAGLLLAGCAGIGAALTFVAFGALLLYGARLGVAAAVFSVPAWGLQVLLMVVASKLVAELLGAAAKSRITMEITAAQYGLFVAAMSIGWFLIPLLGDVSVGLAEGVTGSVRTVLFALPSGWGLASVEAAGRGDAALAVSALVGLAFLDALGFIAWTRLLQRRITQPAFATPSRPGNMRPRMLLAGPLGAVIEKDLRSWWRDPTRGLDLRSTLWAAAFITIALWVFEPAGVAFAGTIVAIIGAMASVNVYAMDGTALWCTLVVPGAERTDVRGRQLAWLLVFGSAAAVVTAIGITVVQATWAIPWILALLPAVLGGAAGLIPLLSVVALVPETDVHKRSSNPAETGGDATGLYFAMLVGTALLAAPAGALLATSALLDEPALAWIAAVVGIVTGVAYAWALGEIAVRRLTADGPDLLQQMRVGPRARTAIPETTEMSAGIARRVAVLTTISMVSIFPQGLVPLGFTVAGVDEDVRVWFVPRFLPAAVQVPAAVTFIVLGLVAGWYAMATHRNASSAALDRTS